VSAAPPRARRPGLLSNPTTRGAQRGDRDGAAARLCPPAALPLAERILAAHRALPLPGSLEHAAFWAAQAAVTERNVAARLHTPAARRAA